jgi:hypothetical protein
MLVNFSAALNAPLLTNHELESPLQSEVVMLSKLPKVGQWFEFDYTYRNEKTEVVKLNVVDVTDEHVLYKMPSVSVNKIFPMTHEYWLLNQDERRPCKNT